MNYQNKVTVLLPAYQSAEFIQKTLDSLSQQTHYDLKVIISVDLCEDETYMICQQQCSNDSRFSVVRQEKRLGYVGNCNFLLDQADSEYAFFAFHDDILDAKYVQTLCTVLDKHPEVVMAYSDLLLTKVDGAELVCEYRVMDGIEDSVDRGLAMFSRKGYWWVPNRGVFRLGEARKIKGLKIHAAGEFSVGWPWLFHMSLLGQFQSVSELLCFKYYQKESLSRSWEFTQRQWYGATLSCVRETWASPISFCKKSHLSLYLLWRLLKLQLLLKKQAFRKMIKKEEINLASRKG